MLIRLDDFPDPLPSELLYSTFARYHILSANPRLSTTLLEAFGSSAHYNPSAACPGKVLQLSRVVPSDHPFRDPRTIALKHSSLPYHIRFYSKQRKKQLLALYLDSGPRPLFSALGLARCPQGRDEFPLAFCPQCVVSDRRKHGSPYWHVEHQLPMAAICHEHGCPLQIGCSTCGPLIEDRFTIALPGTPCSCPVPAPLLRASSGRSDLDVWIAAESTAAWIDGREMSAEAAYELRAQVIGAGYKRYNSVDYLTLSSDLVAWLGKDLFTQLGGADIAGLRGSEDRWVRRLLEQRNASLGTLRVLALQKMIRDRAAQTTVAPGPPSAWREHLGAAFSELKSITAVARRFGKGWQTVRDEAFRQGIRLNRKRRPAAEKERAAAITSLLLDGYRVVDASQQLGVSLAVVRSIVSRDPSLHAAVTERDIERRKAAYRERVLAAVAISATRSEVNASAQAAANWLRKYDAVWLESVLPPALQRGAPIASASSMLTEWSVVDEQWALQIRATAASLFKIEPPVFVSAWSITEALKVTARVHAHRAQLPRVCQALHEVTEHRNIFHRRRLAWSVRHLASERVRATWRDVYLNSRLSYAVMVRERQFVLENAKAHDLTLTELSTNRVRSARSLDGEAGSSANATRS